MMRTTCVIQAAFLLAAAGMPAAHARVYTFDYAVHADSDDAKPLVIFNTGKATYFELPDGVEIKGIIVRKNKTERPSSFYRSGSYVVVPEPHDSMTVVTDKGEFTAEYVGPRGVGSGKKTRAQHGKTGHKKISVSQDDFLPEKQERIIEIADRSEHEKQFKGSFETVEIVEEQPASEIQAKVQEVPQNLDLRDGQDKLVINILSGTALSSAVAEFASSNDHSITWQARERYATVNLKFEGSFESIIDDIARTFGLTAYLAGKTLVFVDAR